MFRRWAESIGQGLLVVVIVAFLPGWFVAYLARIQSTWTYPVLIGIAASALVSVGLLAILAIRRLPPKHLIPTVNNIENCVRTWLDHFHAGVKVSPDENCYFRVLATMDSGTSMLVGRLRGEYSEYVLVKADIKPTTEELATVQALSERDRQRIIVSIRLELARRYVGYSGLQLPADEFHIL